MDLLSFQSDSMGEGAGRLPLSCQLFLSPSQTLVLKILLSDFVIIHNGDSLTVQRSPEDRRYVCTLKVCGVHCLCIIHSHLSALLGEAFPFSLNVSNAICRHCSLPQYKRGHFKLCTSQFLMECS